MTTTEVLAYYIAVTNPPDNLVGSTSIISPWSLAGHHPLDEYLVPIYIEGHKKYETFFLIIKT